MKCACQHLSCVRTFEPLKEQRFCSELCYLSDLRISKYQEVDKYRAQRRWANEFWGEYPKKLKAALDRCAAERYRNGVDSFLMEGSCQS